MSSPTHVSEHPQAHGVGSCMCLAHIFQCSTRSGLELQERKPSAGGGQSPQLPWRLLSATQSHQLSHNCSQPLKPMHPASHILALAELEGGVPDEPGQPGRGGRNRLTTSPNAPNAAPVMKCRLEMPFPSSSSVSSNGPRNPCSASS